MTAPVIEHTSPPAAVTDPDSGDRVYIHPITMEIFTSATTALGIIDKDALPYWYGKQSAIRAAELIPRLNAATRVPFCGDRWCGECLPCLMREIQAAGNDSRDAAADLGARFHHVAEQFALTGKWIPYDKDLAGRIEQFQRFLMIHRVEFHAAEVTVINRANQWAGTLDTVLSCGWMPPKHRDLIGIPVYADYKTGSIHPQAGLQLAAYRNGEAVLLPSGAEHPMPGAHTETGLSIQITNEDFWVRPCPVGASAYTKFLRALDLWRDIHQPDLDLVERAMYKPRPRRTTPTGESNATA